MKKMFQQKTLMTEKHDKDFKNYAKCLIWDHVDGNVKVRDHCQVTGKYGG